MKKLFSVVTKPIAEFFIARNDQRPSLHGRGAGLAKNKNLKQNRWSLTLSILLSILFFVESALASSFGGDYPSLPAAYAACQAQSSYGCGWIWPQGYGGTCNEVSCQFRSCPDAGYAYFQGHCVNNCPANTHRDAVTSQCIGNQKNDGVPLCSNTGGTNPINIGVGNKFQQETDFKAPSGPLLFQRSYNSDGLFQPAYLGNAWTGTYDRTVVSTTTAASVTRPDGKTYTFTLVTNIWTPDADISDRLTQQVDGTGAVTGWVYRQASDDSVEMYNAVGKLISITSRSGQTQTLTYSDGTTGANGGYISNANGNPTTTVLPAGLLLRVTDNFNRTLSFSYDAFPRVVSMTDPINSIYHYGYDVYGNLITVTYPDNKTRTYIYDETTNSSIPQGSDFPYALTGLVDENGNRFATWKYDSSGRAISSEHDLPNNVPVEKVSIAYTTDANGNVTSSAVTDALNTTRTYSFQTVLGVSKNTGVSQPCSSGCGAASATTYDTNGNISSRTDFNGSITNYIYDLTRNLETSRTEAYGTPQARTITTAWHATYRLPTLITEPGKTTAFTYDTSGNLLTKTITDTALNKSRTWTSTYNSLGQVLTTDGPRTDVSDITTNTYYTSASTTTGSVHSLGDLATVTNALSQVTSITNYDLNGRPLTITDPNGVVTTLTYWPRGWLKTRTVNGSQTTTYDYDGVGQLTKVTLPDTSYLSYTYDTAHRLTDVVDNAGNKTHYTLDAMGNRTQEDTKDPSGNILKTRSRVFDALNRLQKDIGGTSPTTQITQYGYDNNGNLKTITDPLNHLTTNGYDALNRLITVTDPANGVATNTYNALNQLTQVKDPRLVATNYTVDALGNVTLTQSPDSGNTQTVYDAAGNVTQKTDARGIVSNYTYDALNRVTSITYPANTAENVSFTYDSVANGNKGVGRLTGYSNDGGATVLVYDSLGNITQQTEQIGTQYYVTSYLYDTANRVSQITYPSGRIVIYTRNALGQVTQVQTKDTSASAAVTLLSGATYYPFGPLSTLAFANGVTTTTQLDADYRVSRITTNSTPAWDFIYSRDAASNITGMADQISTYSKTYGYDNLNRVTNDVNNIGTWTYQYDAGGNRTKRINSSTQTLTFASDSNRMTKNGSTAQTLDAAGNLTASGTKAYTYNNADRLMSYSTGSTLKAQYSYNALGQRTIRAVKPQHLHYDLSGRYLDETLLNSGGTFSARYEYIYADDTPIAQIKTLYGTNNAVSSRRTTYIHADHLNTPRVMTDSTQKVVWRWDGDAYGKTAPNQNPDGDSTTDILNLRFPGQHFDTESGFYYNIHRDYDSDVRGYTQSDPIGLRGGLNTYGYANGNPLLFTDPTGLAAQCVGDDDRCKKMKDTCIAQCSKSSLPSGNNGFKFWNCVNKCMLDHGCSPSGKPLPEPEPEPSPKPFVPVVPMSPIGPMPTMPPIIEPFPILVP